MRSNETELKFLYLTIDLVILNIAIGIMYYINPVLRELNSHEMSLYVLLINMSDVITYSVFSRRNLYLHDTFSNRVKRISNRILIFIAVLFVLAHLFLPENFSNLFFLKCSLIFYIGKLIFYFFLYTYLRFSREKGFYVHNVIILGANDMGIFLRNLLDNNPMLGYNIVIKAAVENSGK